MALRPAMNFIVSTTCAGSHWRLDQWRPLQVIATANHVVHTTPPKLLRAFISLTGYLASFSLLSWIISSWLKLRVPGVSDCARCRARVIVGFMSRRRRTDAQNLHRGRNKTSWSMSWRAPRPFSRVAAAPPSNNTGDSAIWAFFTAVNVFVRPMNNITNNNWYLQEDCSINQQEGAAVEGSPAMGPSLSISK